MRCENDSKEYESTKYCHLCGRELIFKIYKDGYDVKTGKVRIWRGKQCPKADSFWSALLDECHTEFMREEIDSNTV